MDSGIKKSAIGRLNIVRGQVGGLQKMVQEENYCIDIIRQSLAIREALSSFDNLILENHLVSHVIHQMKGKEIRKVTKELLEIYKLSKRM